MTPAYAGEVVSTTVTVKDADARYTAASLAVQVTVVVPTEKVVPDKGVQVGPLVTPTSSVAVAGG